MRKSILSFFLVGYLIIVSCKSNGHSEQSDSSGIKKDTIPLNASIEPEDSTFDSYGFYHPVDTIKVKNYIFSTLSISTTDVRGTTGDVRTDSNRAVKVTAVSITLRHSKTDVVKPLEFKDFIVKKNKLELNITDPEIGKFSLTGKFTGNKGPEEDNVEADAIVLKGTLIINDEPAKEVSFTWFGGD